MIFYVDIELRQPGGRTVVFKVRNEGHEVWLEHPVRAEFGSNAYRHRFLPHEAEALARGLLSASAEVRGGR
jgi:hypothetical protein